MASPADIGSLPMPGVEANPISLDGHEVSRIRDGVLILDGGSAVAGRQFTSPEASIPLYDGFLAVEDLVHHPLRAAEDDWVVALDGTDLVGWQWVGDGAGGQMAESYRQTLTNGWLRLGRVLGSYEATGIIPHAIETLRERGIHMPLDVFQPTAGGGA